MKCTVFRTGTSVESSIGLNKVIIKYPGGINNATGTIRVDRKSNQDESFKTFRLRVYNGHIWHFGQNRPYEEVATTNNSVEVTTDEQGNTVRLYTLFSGVSGASAWQIYFEIGVTRVEVLDVDNLNYVGIAGSSGSSILGELNVEQFAHLPFEIINSPYSKTYGNLEAFKNKAGLKSIGLSGSEVVGDIKNLIASASTLEGLYVYNTKVYGNLEILLEAMKAAGVTNRTLTLAIGQSGVTYQNATPTGIIYFDFDGNGDYELRS